MILNFNAAQHERDAKDFCLAVQREFAIRSGAHKPASTRERKWLAEGMKPIHQFESVCEMIASGLVA